MVIVQGLVDDGLGILSLHAHQVPSLWSGIAVLITLLQACHARGMVYSSYRRDIYLSFVFQRVSSASWWDSLASDTGCGNWNMMPELIF